MTATAAGSPIANPLDRRSFIGGSDIGAILGWNKYRTPLDVFNEKRGITPPFEGNAHTQRGNALEKIAAEFFEDALKLDTMRKNLPLVHGEYPFLRGSIDRKVVGQPAIVEIKCPSLGSFAKIKREGLREDYIAQMQWYLGLGGYERGYWAIFCADQWEMVTFPVEADAELFASMVERAVAFWRDHIIPGLAPEPRKEDEARLEIARVEGQYPLVTRTDPDFVEALGQVAEAKRLAAEAEALEDAAKARVLELIESKPGIYVTPTARLSYTTTKGRSSFDQKALAAARPIDRASIRTVLRDMGNGDLWVAGVLDRCGLDLAQFSKVGAPGTQFRITSLGRGEE